DFCLSIIDTGVGIPADHIPHIFDRYYQSPNNTHQKKEGLGIGLAITKEIIELHDGNIEVTSNPGEGSNFTIRLPKTSYVVMDTKKIDQELTSLIAEPNELLTSKDWLNDQQLPVIKVDGIHQVILVVDDHPDIRAYIIDLLDQKDYQVIEAKHGAQAIQVLKNIKVDLIITDLMMDVMDGFELIKRVKLNHELMDIPVLVVSAKDDYQDTIDLMKIGVTNVLTKPFDATQLSLLISNLLKQDRNEQYTLSKAVSSLDDYKTTVTRKLETFVVENIGADDLKINDYARAIGVSQRSLNRIIKQASGKTPGSFIKEIKLAYAYELFRNHKVKSVREAALAIGYKNSSDMKKHFESHFQIAPEALMNT
ncbi:MAG: response regulator, partial [Bacteroidota bacterium]